MQASGILINLDREGDADNAIILYEATSDDTINFY